MMCSHWPAPKDAGTLPRLYFDCGTEDDLLEPNRALHRELEKMAVPHDYREFPGGHDWDYWNRHIRDALGFHFRGTNE